MTDILAAPATIDTARLTELVRKVCRIPSVLGDEGPLAAFLHDLMRESGFEATELQPVIGDRPNALGELRFGAGPRVVFTGHLDTKPVSHGWMAATPFSGDLIDGNVYGHGIMDMKAALVCQIVAMEALTPTCSPRTPSSNWTAHGCCRRSPTRSPRCSARRRSCRPGASTAAWRLAALR